MSHLSSTSTRRPAPPARAAARAFSLLELVIVLAIIAIVSAIAIPRYGSTNHTFRLQAAVDRVSEDLEFARALARSKSTPVSVTFSPTDSHYWVTLDPNGAPSVVSEVRLAEDPYGVQIRDVTIGAGRVLKFNGYGDPDYDAEVQIQKGERVWSLLYSKDAGRSVLK